MATTTVPTSTPAEQPTRRGLMAGIAAAGVLGSTPALAGTDPHLAWERRLELLRAATADKEAGPLDDELYALEERIAETPARSMAGVLVQLRLARRAVLDQVWDESSEAALLNAFAALERLAGGRASA